MQATEEFGVGTTGSRLLNGTYSLHVALEQQIANWLGRDDALVFTTGYQTNVGTIQGLLGPDCLAVVDSYVHASIRDGVRLSQAVEAKFDHNDVASLVAALRSHAGTSFRRILVLVDSLYSMEGSTAPLEQIIDVCKDAGALLMVDEAHGIGVFGPTGGGLTERNGVAQDIDILMGSLSKAIGGLGGFVVELAGHHRRDPAQRQVLLVQHLRNAGVHGCRRRRHRHHPRRRGAMTVVSVWSATPGLMREALQPLDVDSAPPRRSQSRLVSDHPHPPVRRDANGAELEQSQGRRRLRHPGDLSGGAPG